MNHPNLEKMIPGKGDAEKYIDQKILEIIAFLGGHFSVAVIVDCEFKDMGMICSNIGGPEDIKDVIDHIAQGDSHVIPT